MKNSRFKIQNFLILASLIFTLCASSCGYQIIGSRPLSFNSVTIKPVQNKTYEPRLEERLHDVLSKEFLNQGIEVKAKGGDVEIEAIVTTFRINTIGIVEEVIKEQELIMLVDVKLSDNTGVTEFKAMRSPIKITFQSTGTVSESVAHKKRATDKACREIAKEIVGRIILSYAK
jgi:hypothetical protein